MDLSRNKAIYHFRITKRDDKTEEMVNRFKRDTSSISIRLRSEDLKNDFTQVHNLSDIIEEFESRYDGYDMNMSQLMDEVEEIIKSTEQIKGGKKIGTKIPKLPLTQLRKISSCKKYPDIHRMNTQLLKPRSDSVMRSTQRSISKIIESHRNIVESSPF